MTASVTPQQMIHHLSSHAVVDGSESSQFTLQSQPSAARAKSLECVLDHVTIHPVTQPSLDAEMNRVSKPVTSVERDGDCRSATAEVSMTPEIDVMKTLGVEVPSNSHKPEQQQPPPPPSSAHPEDAKNQTLDEQLARLRDVFNNVSTEAVQKLLREQWRTFLFSKSNDDHVAFILRAGFKNANANIIERVIRDESVFRIPVIEAVSRKPATVEHVLAKATYAQLIKYVPNQVLDEAIAERIKDAPAKNLIKWLAEGGRLGYRTDDVVDDEDEWVAPNEAASHSDHVVMTVHDQYRNDQEKDRAIQIANHNNLQALKERRQREHAEMQRRNEGSTRNLAAQMADIARPGLNSISAPNPQLKASQPQSGSGLMLDPLVPSQEGGFFKACPKCQMMIRDRHGYSFHTNKRVCEKAPPVGGWRILCPRCCSGFTQKQGLEYHIERNVCCPHLKVSANPQEDAPPPAPRPYPLIQDYPRPQFTSRKSSDSIVLPQGGIALSPGHSVPVAPLPKSVTTPQPYEISQLAPQPQSGLSQSHAIRGPSHVRSSQSGSHGLILRPPLNKPLSSHTPLTSSAVEVKDMRLSPSELPPEKLVALEKELQDADRKLAEESAKIPHAVTEEERQARLTSLKNATATRKSQIRKMYGVSLRMRGKDKLARLQAGIDPKPGLKRARENDDDDPNPILSPNSRARPYCPPNQLDNHGHNIAPTSQISCASIPRPTTTLMVQINTQDAARAMQARQQKSTSSRVGNNCSGTSNSENVVIVVDSSDENDNDPDAKIPAPVKESGIRPSVEIIQPSDVKHPPDTH